MDKGNLTIREVYATAQTDTVIDTPSSSKRFIVWGIVLKTTEGSRAEVKFTTSGDLLAWVDGIGETGVSNVAKEGAVGESISITCPANTTVIIMFDEL